MDHKLLTQAMMKFFSGFLPVAALLFIPAGTPHFLEGPVIPRGKASGDPVYLVMAGESIRRVDRTTRFITVL